MSDDDDDMTDFKVLKTKKQQVPDTSSRFEKPTSSSKMKEICGGFVPKNTKKANSWSHRVFEQWREHRNQSSEEKCPATLLENLDVVSLNYWLSRFVVEARHEDGVPYPVSTIVNLLAGLYRYSKECDPHCPNLMDRKNPAFRDLNGAQQVKVRELQHQGIGTVVKHAPVISQEEEINFGIQR